MPINQPGPTASMHSAFNLLAVTPHAENNLETPCRGLWIGDDGVVAVSVIALSDTSPVTLTIRGPGLLPVAAKAVRVSGTTATNIVALY